MLLPVKYRWARNGAYWGVALACLNFITPAFERDREIIAHFRLWGALLYIAGFLAIYAAFFALIGLGLGAIADWRVRRATR